MKRILLLVGEYGVIGNSQRMTGLELQDLVNLTSVDKSVSAQEVFILADRGLDIVKMVYLDKVSAFYSQESHLAKRFADIRVIRGYQQFHSIVRRGAKGILRGLTFRQLSAHENDDCHPDYKRYETGHEGGEHIHGIAASFFV